MTASLALFVLLGHLLDPPVDVVTPPVSAPSAPAVVTPAPAEKVLPPAEPEAKAVAKEAPASEAPKDSAPAVCPPTSPAATSAAAKAAADEDTDDEDDEDEGTAQASGELEAAHAAEAKALSDDERLRHERLLAPEAVGPGNPLLRALDDLPDVLPQVEEDAREASQIAHELEQFETFDADKASEHYDIPVELNDQVAQYIRAFQGPLRSHFTLWLARSARYIPDMREILEREGVPADTVFLSLIESGFSTLAYSVARAAGQWQFISSTGKRFGLRSDFWVDERRDPTRATGAAAAYLKELRGQLGSWYLAWAGYNAGAGTISKAIRKQHSTDFWELIRGRVLHKETKGYVPKLIAAALIAKHPHAFGFDDIPWQTPVHGELVEVMDATELSFIADAAGTDLDTLRELNPALRRFCTPPPLNGKPYLIRVPDGTADRVAAALKARPAADKLTFKYHRVQPGEGLGAIARQFNVAPEAIARMNGLHRQAVKPGRDLVIPVAHGGTSDERIASISDEREQGGSLRRHGRSRRIRRGMSGWIAADDCQDPFANGQSGEGLVLEPEPALTPSAKPRHVATGVAPESAAVPSDASRYVVADGDTLWTIAQTHNLTLEQICGWNHIAHPAKAKIFPGEKLWVRGEAHALSDARSEAKVEASAAPAPLAAGNPGTSYRLRDGDNLWQVAKKLNVKVADLQRWNHLDEDSVLQPGQVLKLGE